MDKKEYDRLRYLNKKEEIDARNKAYNLKNREKILAYSKEWYQNNLKEERKKRKIWARNNKEKKSEYNNKWRKENKHKVNSYFAKRRANKLQQTPKWADLNAIEEFYKNCPKGYEVDHIIPLQGENVRGLHILENLQYLTKFKNRSKGNRV